MLNYSILNKDIILETLFIDIQLKSNDGRYGVLESPESSMIACATVGTLKRVEDEIKRDKLYTIQHVDEFDIILNLCDTLNYYHDLSLNRSVPYQLHICGELVDSEILPYLISKVFQYREKLSVKDSNYMPKFLRSFLTGIGSPIAVNIDELLKFGSTTAFDKQIFETMGFKTAVKLDNRNVIESKCLSMDNDDERMKYILNQSKNNIIVYMQSIIMLNNI